MCFYELAKRTLYTTRGHAIRVVWGSARKREKLFVHRITYYLSTYRYTTCIYIYVPEILDLFFYPFCTCHWRVSQIQRVVIFLGFTKYNTYIFFSQIHRDCHRTA